MVSNGSRIAGIAVPNTVCTSLVELSEVWVAGSYSSASSSNGPPPALRYPTLHRAPAAAMRRLLRTSGSKLMARSYGSRRHAVAAFRRPDSPRPPPSRASHCASSVRTLSTAVIARASSAFQLPTTRSILAAGASARTAAMPGSAISRSPIRSRRSNRMRVGLLGFVRRRNGLATAADAESSRSPAATSARSRGS